MNTILRTDIIPEALKQKQARVIVQSQFDSIINNAESQASIRSKTPGTAKNITEFYSLVKEAIENREKNQKTPDDAKVLLTHNEVEVSSKALSIAIELMSREPGRFSEGAPMQGKTRNLRPLLREVVADPDNPGYRKAIMGYWHDNLVKFTCWSRTHKEAEALALSFEALMEDYIWFFRMQGVHRVLFNSRGSQVEREFKVASNQGSDTNKFYGRPLIYFVQTETIRTITEKELEQIIINIV